MRNHRCANEHPSANKNKKENWSPETSIGIQPEEQILCKRGFRRSNKVKKQTSRKIEEMQ